MRWYLHVTPRDVACAASVGRVAENGPDVLPLNLIAIVPFFTEMAFLDWA